MLSMDYNYRRALFKDIAIKLLDAGLLKLSDNVNPHDQIRDCTDIIEKAFSDYHLIKGDIY